MAVTRRHVANKPKPVVEPQRSAVRRFLTPAAASSTGRVNTNTFAMCISRKKESADINGASKASKNKITMTITREKIEVVNEVHHHHHHGSGSSTSTSNSSNNINNNNNNNDDDDDDQQRQQQKLDKGIWPKVVRKVCKSKSRLSSKTGAKTTTGSSSGGLIKAAGRMRSESEGDFSPEVRMMMRNEEDVEDEDRKRQIRRHRRLRWSHRRIWQQKRRQQRKLLSHTEMR